MTVYFSTQALVTVDDEVGESAKNDPSGFEKFVLGKIGGQQFGSPLIAEMANDFGVSVEFFTDVYESAVFGEDCFERHCLSLIKQNHFIQLHTHPGFEFDSGRRNLYEYTFSEQVDIIETGANRIEKWTGFRPVAHRAGMYGANDSTLLALNKSNIPIDSSYFHKHPNCLLNIPTINEPYQDKVARTLEIPITTLKTYPKLLGISIPIRPVFRKIDVNSMKPAQMANAIAKLNGNVKYIVIFLHSSSFIARQSNNEISVNHGAIDTYRAGLESFKSLNIEVITFKKIHEEHR